MAKRLHQVQIWLDEDEEGDINAFLVERAQLTASAPFSFHDFAQAAVNEMLVKARAFLWSIRPAMFVSSLVPVEEEGIDFAFLVQPSQSSGASSDGQPEKRSCSGPSSEATGQAGNESS